MEFGKSKKRHRGVYSMKKNVNKKRGKISRSNHYR